MLLEIREQGEVLDRVLGRCGTAVREIASRHRGRRLHLVGCGDMYFAAAEVAAIAELVWGLPVRAWRPMELRWAHRRLSPDDLVVCASISGRTPRTVEAAMLARQANAPVLGITDNPGSPLDTALDETLIVGTAPPEQLETDPYAGYRHIIAQTQTFTAVLFVELMLAAAIGETEADVSWIPGRVGSLVELLDPRAEQAAAFFTDGRRVVVLGSGPHLPAARYGAAKMLEFAVPATAQCLEEFNHLEVFVADRATRIILLAADDEAHARAAELTGPWETLGTRSLVLAASGEAPGPHTQLLTIPGGSLIEAVLAEIVALQLLAARGVGIMGRDPGRWLGGRRTDLVQSMSHETIRGSRLWKPGC